jgi:hypothetical protein
VPEEIFPPFSARNRGAHAQIDNDCPESTRIGLLHLLHRLADREYVGWDGVVGELQRIARVLPDHSNDPDSAAHLLLHVLPWDKVFDFCERLHGHLTKDVHRYNRQTEELDLVAPKSDVQEYLASELRTFFSKNI